MRASLCESVVRVSEEKLGIENVLETIAVVLIILWVLGLVSAYTMGGLIHILLVVAIVVILIRVIRGQRL